MLHVTCDLCGKKLETGEDHHFVVKIEAFAAHDPAEITEADLDEDHMEAISQLLREEEDPLADSDLQSLQQKNFRYDLCPECHKKFVRDPLGKEVAQKTGRQRFLRTRPRRQGDLDLGHAATPFRLPDWKAALPLAVVRRRRSRDPVGLTADAIPSRLSRQRSPRRTLSAFRRAERALTIASSPGIC